MNTNLEDNKMRTAQFVRTIDGDTFVADIALVPPLIHPAPFFRASIRVHGWNAAEMSETEGPAMRDYFDLRLIAAKEIRLRLLVMSFTRIVADVFLDDVLFLGELRTRLMAIRQRKEGE